MPSVMTGHLNCVCLFYDNCVMFCSLQEMLKYSKSCEGADDLQEALTSILGILKAVNDSMHLIAITGYEVKLSIESSPRRQMADVLYILLYYEEQGVAK